MTPFIVSATRRCDGCAWNLNEVPEACQAHGAYLLRRAAPTLDKAVGAACEVITDARRAAGRLISEWGDCYSVARALTEAGGTIPLPDGSRVEVQPRSWRELGDDMGHHHWPLGKGEEGQFIARWNREHDRGEHNTASTAGYADADASGNQAEEAR